MLHQADAASLDFIIAWCVLSETASPLLCLLFCDVHLVNLDRLYCTDAWSSDSKRCACPCLTPPWTCLAFTTQSLESSEIGCTFATCCARSGFGGKCGSVLI